MIAHRLQVRVLHFLFHVLLQKEQQQLIVLLRLPRLRLRFIILWKKHTKEEDEGFLAEFGGMHTLGKELNLIQDYRAETWLVRKKAIDH